MKITKSSLLPTLLTNCATTLRSLTLYDNPENLSSLPVSPQLTTLRIHFGYWHNVNPPLELARVFPNLEVLKIICGILRTPEMLAFGVQFKRTIRYLSLRSGGGIDTHSLRMLHDICPRLVSMSFKYLDDKEPLFRFVRGTKTKHEARMHFY